jgi:glycosyltransferase involved in cell wall biosynthesis
MQRAFPTPMPASCAKAEATVERGRAIIGERPTTLRVLAIGRLTYYKGHEVLIRAAAELPEARVLIVGSGDLEESLNAFDRRTLGLTESVFGS